MSGGRTSARSDRPDLPGVDVEERSTVAIARPEPDGGEAAWSPTPVLRARRGRRDRTGTWIALTLVAIAVAAIKPWGVGFPVPSAGIAAEASVPAPSLPTTAPQATAAPVIADPNAMTCLVHQVEQVLTLERWPDREIKSWSQPVGGVVTVSSNHVVGIGVCPGIGPAEAAGGPEASRVPEDWGGAVVTDVERIDEGVGQDLGAPARITQQTDYVAAGVLYGPPSPGATTLPVAASGAPGAPGPAWRQGTSDAGPWPPGRYRLSYFFPGDPESVIRTVTIAITAPLNGG